MDIQKINNYRPVTLLPAVSNILEKVVCFVVLIYLETILNVTQTITPKTQVK